MNKKLEMSILNDILEFLNFYPNIEYWRQNNVGVYDPVNRCFRKPPKYSPKGICDIMGYFKDTGAVFAIEVKRPGEKPSETQQAFLDKINQTHLGYAFVACSIDDVQLRLGPPGYNNKGSKIA